LRVTDNVEGVRMAKKKASKTTTRAAKASKARPTARKTGKSTLEKVVKKVVKTAQKASSKKAPRWRPEKEDLSTIRIAVTTIGDLLLTAADRYPNDDAIVFPDHKVTYGELAARAISEDF
jgi:flagellar hook-basal body complex protein FliE